MRDKLAIELMEMLNKINNNLKLINYVSRN